jgi:hypothetical protein
MCAQRQLGLTAAMNHSLSMATRKRTPIKTPTVATEAVVIRKMNTETSSQAMPVSRNIHQGPASRHSAARVLDRRAVHSSMGLMTASLPALVAAAAQYRGGGPLCRMITRFGLL